MARRHCRMAAEQLCLTQSALLSDDLNVLSTRKPIRQGCISTMQEFLGDIVHRHYCIAGLARKYFRSYYALYLALQHSHCAFSNRKPIRHRDILEAVLKLFR